VIEAISSDAKHKNYQMDLLMDLPTIQHMAEDEVGHIDRIDIVRH
jgi:type IV secretory pathway VirD2 relaxase